MSSFEERGAHSSSTCGIFRGRQSKFLIQDNILINNLLQSFNWDDKFLPVVDTFLADTNRYLPLDPVHALREGTYLQVPILTGISKPITDEQFSKHRFFKPLILILSF